MITKTALFNPVRSITFLALLLATNEKVMAEAPIVCCKKPPTCCVVTPAERRAFVKIISGASFSRKADISADPSFWDPATEGYNSSLGTAPLLGVGLGYRVWDFLAFDVSLTQRWGYEYRKNQTTSGTPLDRPALPSKTRKFDLNSTSAMFNARLLGRGINGLFYNVDCAGSYVAPFLGAGLGFSYNKVSNFYSELAPNSLTTPFNSAASIGPSSSSRTSFAYQFEAGAEYKYKETWGLSVGYRWFDGGKFKTPNHIIGGTGLAGNPLVGIVAPSWKGRLRAHEIFAEVSYHF